MEYLIGGILAFLILRPYLRWKDAPSKPDPRESEWLATMTAKVGETVQNLQDKHTVRPPASDSPFAETLDHTFIYGMNGDLPRTDD